MEKKYFISQSRLLKWALSSNALYIFYVMLYRPDGITLSKLFVTSFLMFSVISCSVLIFKNWFRLKDLSIKAKLLFLFLFAYGLIVIARSFSYSLQDWVTNFGNVYMAMAWLTPALLVLGLKVTLWTHVYKGIYFMFIISAVAFFIHFLGLNTPVEEWNWLLRPVNFILLTSFYRYSVIRKIGVVLVLILYSYIAIYTKFRFEFLYLGVVLLFLVVDRIFTIKSKKIIYRYIMFIFVALLSYIFVFGYESFSSFVATIVEFQDSRSFLFTELFSDLNRNEQIFGRGSLGTYYSEFFEGINRWYKLLGNKGWRGDNVIRITTEVGYLQMILKGGFVLLVLYSSLAFYAVFLALFRSNNKFIKRLGFYILIILILSIISLRPAFTPTFILFWISIGTVLNKKYRIMSDNQINSLIKV